MEARGGRMAARAGGVWGKLPTLARGANSSPSTLQRQTASERSLSKSLTHCSRSSLLLQTRVTFCARVAAAVSSSSTHIINSVMLG